MKTTRSTDEQIIGFLKQAEAGMSIKDICRSGDFSQPTFYKWRPRFSGMEASDAAKLRDLEAENNKLKKLLAEAHLDIHALKPRWPRQTAPLMAGQTAPGKTARL